MAKSSPAASQKKASPFWKPKEVDESIEGIFASYQPTKTPDGDAGLAIALESGKLIPVGYSVGHSIRENKLKLKVGQKLRFVYLGKGGRSKVIQMYVDGKEIPIPSAFAPATDEEVAAYLEHLEEKTSLKGKK
jgi:hypothetical protein